MKNRKIFYRFIISYTVVLMIPILLISLLLNTLMANNLKDQTVDFTTGMLTQIRDTMDSRFKDLNNISSQISVNPRLYPLLWSDDINQVDNFPIVTNAITELQNYKVTNSIIDNIFLFFKNSEVIVSNSSKLNYTYQFPIIYSWENYNTDAFYDLINTINDITVLPSQNLYTNNQKKKILTYLQPLPTNHSNYSATLFITIPQTILEEPIKKMLGQNRASIFILDSKNNMVMDISLNNSIVPPETLSAILYSAKDTQTTVYSTRLDKYIVTYVKSDISNWQYLSIMDSAQILSKINYVEKIYTQIAVLALIIGLIMAYYFSHKNYSSVRKYANENASLEEKLLNQMPIIRNNFLLNLIKGNITDTEKIQSMVNFINLPMNSSVFTVIIIAIDNYKQFKEVKSQPEQDVSKLSVINMLETAIGSSGLIHAVEIDNDRLGIIVCLTNDVMNCCHELLKSASKKVQEYTRNALRFTVTISISNQYYTMSEIRCAFKEACIALDYRIVKGENSVISYEDISNIHTNKYYYSFESEKEIMNSLRLGDANAIHEVLKEIVLSTKGASLPLETIKCIYFEIINTAIKAVDELELNNINIDLYLPRFASAVTLDEVYDEVCKFYSTLCIHINESKNYKNKQLRDNILKYLERNYSDKLISAESVADFFSVSTSYLSRLFKDQVGENFVDYLHSIRLSKAKHMLSVTENTVLDIADAVGYNSLSNFTRVFKRYEGITPTEYRASSKL